MKSPIPLNDLLACSIKAAQAAGNHAFQNHHRRSETIETFDHDVKLKLDVECQEKAESVIKSKYPDHAILGEEDTKAPSGSPEPCRMTGQPSPHTWIIDPIDGTVNFHHGLPWWCASVAVEHNGQVVAGAVYTPQMEETYTASLEQTAKCNGKSIKVSTTARLSDSIILTGMDKKLEPNLKPYEIFSRIASNARKARITGSAALDLCQVACGRADGYFESGIYLWDVAAAELIVKQAGGKAEILKHLDNNHRMIFMASNNHIYSELRKLTAFPAS
ncbi:inositol monophosphatase family protein [Verrucomicrobiota bacterium]